VIAGDHENGHAIGQKALEMADHFALQELRAHALTTIGMAKEAAGDRSGRLDERHALDLAVAVDSPIAPAIANNLAIEFMFDGDLLTADRLWTESARLAERFGAAEMLRWVSGTRVSIDFFLGRWDQALEGADEFIRLCETSTRHQAEWLVRWVRGSIREATGDVDGALADHVRGVAVARENGNAIYLAETLCHASIAHAARGDEAGASAALLEATELIRRAGLVSALAFCSPVARLLGLADDLRQAVDEAPGTEFRGWRPAIEAALDGDFRSAANAFAAMPAPAFEARMRLEAGARLFDEGRYEEGGVELERALEFYGRVDAHAYVERAEALLASAQSESA
jgi:tetratricopeptide (TPR) repeat protein